MSTATSKAGDRSSERSWAGAVLPALVTLLGAALRFYDLGTESYWMDEITMIRVAGGSADSLVAEALSGRPPIYVFAAHYWMLVFGTSEAAARALSAVAGTLALPAMYLLGKRLFGRQVGLSAMFLMAISEFQIYHSQDLRYYPFVVLFTLLSFLFLTRALARHQPVDLALYALTATLTFYSHTYAFLVLVAQGLYLLVRWRHLRPVLGRWALTLGSLALLVGPGFLLAFGQTASGTNHPLTWIPTPRPAEPLLTLYKYLMPMRALPAWQTAVVGALYVALTMGLLLRRVGPSRWGARLASTLREAGRALRCRWSDGLLLGLWLTMPLLVPFVASLIVEPVFVIRYTIPAALALYLLVALAIEAMHRAIPRYVALGLLAILILPGLVDYYREPVKEQWREAAALVQSGERAGDVIVFVPRDSQSLRPTFNHYYRGAARQCDLATERFDGATFSQELAGCVGEAGRFWVVLPGYGERVAPQRAYLHEPQNMGASGVQVTELHDLAVFLVTR
ncbi:MAG: glycosyltransferase family 39 protein [Chloroflexota bacterium]